MWTNFYSGFCFIFILSRFWNFLFNRWIQKITTRDLSNMLHSVNNYLQLGGLQCRVGTVQDIRPYFWIQNRRTRVHLWWDKICLVFDCLIPHKLFRLETKFWIKKPNIILVNTYYIIWFLNVSNKLLRKKITWSV